MPTATPAPRLRLHRDTVRHLSPTLPRKVAACSVVNVSNYECPPSRECDVTFGCTQFGDCGPTYEFTCDTV